MDKQGSCVRKASLMPLCFSLEKCVCVWPLGFRGGEPEPDISGASAPRRSTPAHSHFYRGHRVRRDQEPQRHRCHPEAGGKTTKEEHMGSNSPKSKEAHSDWIHKGNRRRQGGTGTRESKGWKFTAENKCSLFPEVGPDSRDRQVKDIKRDKGRAEDSVTKPYRETARLRDMQCKQGKPKHRAGGCRSACGSDYFQETPFEYIEGGHGGSGTQGTL
ncbi:hypothetical protein PAMP_003841 [Pampus punctatissimus]